MIAGLFLSLDTIVETLSPWLIEVCFLITFPLGYYAIGILAPAPGKGGATQFAKATEVCKADAKPHAKASEICRVDAKELAKATHFCKGDARKYQLRREVERAASAGDNIGVVKAWRMAEEHVATDSDTLWLVVPALCSVSPGTLADEIARHMEAHRAELCNARTALVILDRVSRGQPTELLDQVCDMLRSRMSIPMTYQMYEALLAGHAFAGNSARIDEVYEEVDSIGQKLTARAFLLVIKGFLSSNNLNVGLKYVRAMRSKGYFVPAFSVGLLLKVATEAECLADVFHVCVGDDIALPDDCIKYALETCFKTGDTKLAASIEASLRVQGELSHSAVAALLKIYGSAADTRALGLWAEFVKSGATIEEGLLVRTLARSADSKFLKLADEVAKYCREHNRMSLAVYSALMKVYGNCGFCDRACDLYPEIVASGLTPDSVMYGCLLRLSMECGRTDLAKELSRCAPRLDIHHFMSLIRCAGREKDSIRASELLSKVEQSGEKLDLASYNCALDAFISAGDMARASELAMKMHKTFGRLDIVSCNALLKGFASSGDFSAAYRLLAEMDIAGVAPNNISFNSIISSAASKGNFKEAWHAIGKMEERGIEREHYTVFIMLEALKCHGSSYEASRVLAMVDSLSMRETSRLWDLLAKYDKTSSKPSQHFYGALIMVSSTLKNLDKCRSYWDEMITQCAMVPNDIVLGCMMDALVSNDEVTEAVALFREWKDKVCINMVLYTILVKGFAASGRTSEAMDMWQEIRDEGLAMNTVVYNSLIDAQARKGNVEEVRKLFAAMKEAGVPHDTITYSAMVESHCVRGDMQAALEVWSEMKAQGFVKDCVVFNTILDWCTKTNQMSVADTVLEDMDKLRIAPSTLTVGILVNMYGRRRMLDKAFEVVRDMPKKWNFKLDQQVFTCLMDACVLNKSLPRAFEVFEEHRRQDTDYKSFNVYIMGCLRLGRVHEAVGFVEEAFGTNGKKCMLPPGQTLGNDVLEAVFAELSKQGLADEVGMPLFGSLREAGVRVRREWLGSAFEAQHSGGRPRPPPSQKIAAAADAEGFTHRRWQPTGQWSDASWAQGSWHTSWWKEPSQKWEQGKGAKEGEQWTAQQPRNQWGQQHWDEEQQGEQWTALQPRKQWGQQHWDEEEQGEQWIAVQRRRQSPQQQHRGQMMWVQKQSVQK